MGAVPAHLLTIGGLALDKQFALMAEQTAKYAELAQSSLLPYLDGALPYFNQLSLASKQVVLQRLRIFNETCADVLSEGKSLADSASLTWHGLKRLNLRFPSDLFTYIKDHHVIEVYDRNNVQIFRNFRFFDVTSYTMEELLCRSWTDLFRRVDSSHTHSILETSEKFYSRELTSVVPLSHVGAHHIVEHDSPFAYEVSANIDFLAPIYDDCRTPYGFVAIESAHLMSEVPTGLQAEFLLRDFYRRRESSAVEVF